MLLARVFQGALHMGRSLEEVYTRYCGFSWVCSCSFSFLLEIDLLMAMPVASRDLHTELGTCPIDGWRFRESIPTLAQQAPLLLLWTLFVRLPWRLDLFFTRTTDRTMLGFR
jgi:hypothetical protein